MNKETEQKLLNLVKRNYEEIADDFSETRKKYLWPELLKLTAGVKDGDRALDVGCGNGRLLEAFQGKEIEYLGVDSSEKLIEIAEARSKNLEVRSKKFLIDDILELEKLPDIGFDYVFCIAVLHHIPGRDLRVKALEQMKAKLKSGGKIVLTTWNLWSQAKFRRLIFEQGLRKLVGVNKLDFSDIMFKGFKQGSERYYHAFTMWELKKIIELAGMEIDKLYKDKYNYYAVIHKKNE